MTEEQVERLLTFLADISANIGKIAEIQERQEERVKKLTGGD